MRHLLWLFILALTACSGGGAVVFAPTPPPPERVPQVYRHPSGAFSLALPANWSIYEQALTTLAEASFAAPGSDQPLLQVAVVNLGQEVAVGDLLDLVNQYQSQARPDLTRYTELERQAMADGSWRISGLRNLPGGQTQQVNTFIRRTGTLLAVLDISVPAESSRQLQLQSIINTFTLESPENLEATDINTLSAVVGSALRIANLHSWTTSSGVLYVTGEVSNQGAQPVGPVPVTVSLLREDGSSVGGAADVTLGHAIPPGGFAPFSLRFGQGLPLDAPRYEALMGREDWQPQPFNTLASPESLTLLSDSSQYSADGSLFLTGTARNTSAEALRAVRAVATLFDNAGRVIGTGFVDVTPDPLPAGESADFTILISELGGDAANYLIELQALICDEDC